MSMETTTITAAPHPTGKTGAALVRKQAKENGASGEAGAPTFLSLLVSMDPDASADPAANAAPATEGQDGVAAAAVPPDASTLLAQHPNRALKLENPGVAGLAEPGARAGAKGPMAALPGLLDQADAPVAGGHAARRLDKFTDRAQAAGPAGKRVGVAGAGLVAEAPAPSSTAQHVSNTQAMLRRADADRTVHEAAALSVARGGDTRANDTRANETRANETRLAITGANPDARNAMAAPSGNAVMAGAPSSDALGTLVRATANVRSVDRPASRSLFVPAGSALSGSWAEQALSGGSPANTATFSPDAAMPVPETALAEKLNYWITRGVQNAELRLDAFGGGSVEVRIAVQGHDAQVEFRSDQPEARRLLQDAMPQLRDMLKEEGLSLSGGFVGTSAQQDFGAQQRNNHPSAARPAVVRVAAQTLEPRSGSSHAAGRTVDLFV